MAKCRCGSRPRIVSNVVKKMCSGCKDVCANPICEEPKVLSLMAPLIYDEIGINLCATFDIGTDIAEEYPSVTNASLKVISADYAYGADDVLIEAITNRPNCYVITLSNITVQFAMNLFDTTGKLVDTIYPTALFLPHDTGCCTHDEDTNPSSVELELFAPYGLSYDGCNHVPVINFIGFTEDNNFVRQGINLYGISKILDLNLDDSTVTAGLTLVLQSLYFAGYRVDSAGRIEIPKGSIITPDNTDCIRFVAGDLLNLAIKPLDLGTPNKEEDYKESCEKKNECENNAEDDTVVIPGLISEE